MISLCDSWNYEVGVERCAAIGLKMFYLNTYLGKSVSNYGKARELTWKFL